MREVAGVERPFVRACKRLGLAAWKFVSPGRRGVPDRIVFGGIEEMTRELHQLLNCNGGDYAPCCCEDSARKLLSLAIEFVETKAPRGRLRVEQERRIAELRTLGFKVAVLKTPAEVDEWAQSH